MRTGRIRRSMPVLAVLAMIIAFSGAPMAAAANLPITGVTIIFTDLNGRDQYYALTPPEVNAFLNGKYPPITSGPHWNVAGQAWEYNGPKAEVYFDSSVLVGLPDPTITLETTAYSNTAPWGPTPIDYAWLASPFGGQSGHHWDGGYHTDSYWPPYPQHMYGIRFGQTLSAWGPYDPDNPPDMWGTLDFDFLRLSYVPEPTSCSLFVVAGLALLLRRR